MTKAETVSWKHLRNRQLEHKFRRQEPIGRFIVYFVCYEKMLIVEADGAHHLNNRYDQECDEWLKGNGYMVLRFWNNDVLNHSESVLEKINSFLLTR
jgi:very-short-patch-repair endonuclease